MTPTLYFLRSSEQKIVTDMLRYAARLDEAGKTLADVPELAAFERHYGLTHRDLGLYALAGHELAGAAWLRLLKDGNGLPGFADVDTPVLMMAVKPHFRGQGIARAMLEQLLLESGALYGRISAGVRKNGPEAAFLRYFGFEDADAPSTVDMVDGTEVVTLVKTLDRRDVARPTDGYDPTYWMD